MATSRLDSYRAKRDFRRTPEPDAKATSAKGRKSAGLAFTVQKHAASHLHYDFRLEMAGTLRSWAVPKGPSLDPQEKRLAVEVEDHPLSYGDFEGDIPQGQYGGGHVTLWDRGTWEPDGDPVASYAAGKISFTLHGVKLQGRWALVRMRARRTGKPQWLLIKADDDAATSSAEYDILEAEPGSVKGRKTTKTAQRQEAPKAALRRTAHTPERLAAPQLATLVVEPPEGDAWLHEIKLDGYRILADKRGGDVRLWTRGGLDWTHRFPEIAAAVGALSATDFLLDGEVVVLDERGISDFQRLQTSFQDGAAQERRYVVFDLLRDGRRNVTAEPLTARKERLAKLLGAKKPARKASSSEPRISLSEHRVGGGREFFRHCCAQDLEGIVSKRLDAPYRSGRGDAWVKAKCERRQELVIGGFTRPQGKRVGIGALLVGLYERGALAYAGKVGTGFSVAVLKALAAQLEALERDTSPFFAQADIPRGRGVVWVEPQLVAEVRFTGWTRERRLRHPAFMGLREDKAPREVVIEVPSTPPLTPRRVASGAGQPSAAALTHPERVVYPKDGYTKADVAAYYQTIAPWILPFLVGRPLTTVRCPRGVGGKCFVQRHLGEARPATLDAVTIESATSTDEYPIVDDSAGLASLAQLGVIEMHPWPSKARALERPTVVVIDLDPGPDVPWAQIVEAAQAVRREVEAQGLQAFVKTTGGRGLHVAIPVRATWAQAEAFARDISARLVAAEPKRYMASAARAARKGRIYVDVLRNVRGATSVAPYSLRARDGAPVSMPLAWSELTKSMRPTDFTLATVPKLLARRKKDPWMGFEAAAVTLRSR